MGHGVRFLVLVLGVAMGLGTSAHATIQEESCIEPDVEYPLPCDED